MQLLKLKVESADCEPNNIPELDWLLGSVSQSVSQSAVQLDMGVLGGRVVAEDLG